MSYIDDMLRCYSIEMYKRNNEQIFESKGENTPPENYILMEHQDGYYYIYEVHRNDRIKKKQSKDIEQAMIWGIVAHKRMNDHLTDNKQMTEIEEFIKEGKEDCIIDILDEIDKDIYSINKEELMKISMVKEDNKASIIFNKQFIVEKVSLGRAYMVLINYCKRYNEILSFWQKYEKYFIEKNLNKQDIMEFYILRL